jgi:hypothetical protein
MAAKPSNRQKIMEVYIDDNVDINYLIQRVSYLLRKIKRNHERIVVKICAEEVSLLRIKEKGK